QVRLHYEIPTRGLIGFSTAFMTTTKGYGIINHTYKEYKALTGGSYGERVMGVLVSMENGKASAYALNAIEDRGILFIEPGVDIYEGMVVGENAYNSDLAVNPVKEKHLTNMRAAGKDHTSVLKRPKKFSLETALDYLNSDELLEVTPKSFRIRKKILNMNDRKKAEFKSKV
ncbi:MAG: translational GTPase TypA, partial [Bacillales bacterium]|nr:translational GTPase TypA [Bacillales bacterium]